MFRARIPRRYLGTDQLPKVSSALTQSRSDATHFIVWLSGRGWFERELDGGWALNIMTISEIFPPYN